MKKKACFLVSIFIVICLAIVGCSNSESLESSNKDNKPKKEEKKDKEVVVGEKIVSDKMEITINKVEFSYDVLPKVKESFYTHYPAESGKVYIDIAADIKNAQKQELNCSDLLTIEADYNDGYKYSSQTIVEDETTGFTYDNITSIDPLETKGVRFIIDCPDEVKTSDKPVILNFTFDGNKYVYKMK
ncbi:hypothetical protein LVT94_19025 [Clostridioides difficile]|uniref:hypothetical protein n=1 Tax=Clostridioides difficile TaxID=1496 RepID=UPI001A2C830D|nr:hypothetical protein [Clostridioides difficile]MCE4686919.1 hypothetical protein [Clostridioides difficile]MCE4868713.1 hypothetical protein [Clostridioides difficile]MCW0603651.1 hypothetical protein [Clostridioides difficile]MDC2939904.1 hypothetical protein [Clostridioides difficile]